MNKLVSIIIPVYNTEKYLEMCIDSVVNQTYKSIEVICVDDGSVDQSPGILDKYAEKYSFVHVIHQQNQGLSIARNNAIDICKGEYIAFLDSDDFYHPRMIEHMINACEVNRVSMSVCQVCNISDSNVEVDFDICPQYQMHEGRELIDWYYSFDNVKKQQAILVYLKLYSREIFDNIRFPEKRIYEDNSVFHLIATKVDKFVDLQIPLYFRNLREDSIMGETRAAFQAKHLDILLPMQERCSFFETEFSDTKYLREAYFELFHTIRVLAAKINRIEKETRKENLIGLQKLYCIWQKKATHLSCFHLIEKIRIIVGRMLVR